MCPTDQLHFVAGKYIHVYVCIKNGSILIHIDQRISILRISYFYCKFPTKSSKGNYILAQALIRHGVFTSFLKCFNPTETIMEWFSRYQL